MDTPVSSLCLGVFFSLAAAALTGEMLARLGFPLPPLEKRIGRIDGLRGFLALSVMTHHFVIWTQITRLGGIWAAPEMDFFNQLGAGGVSLFFMVTGLLFYPRIISGIRANNWINVYIGRVFRIVPLIVVAVAIVTLISALQTGHGLDAAYPMAALRWIGAVAMPPLLGYDDAGRVIAYVLWSLKYEWQFYLVVLPLCALAIDLIGGRAPNWALPVALLLLAFPGRAFLGSVGMFQYLPLFAVGMLAFEARRRPRLSELLRSRTAAVIAALALALGMTLFHNPYGLALPLFALFFIAVACGNDFGGLLRSRGAHVLGECSYGIYLMHGIVLYLLFTYGTALTELFPTPLLPILMPLVAIVVVLLTALTFLAVERTGIDAGRAIVRLRRALMARSASAT